jgi:tetratricopeptide (TPR) repeat protein
MAGDLSTAADIYRELLERAREFDYWTSEAVAHAGLGLSLLGTDRSEEARECAWRAIAVIADRDEWFEDREILEILLSRLEVVDGRPDTAVQRLSKASQVLEAVDVYVWAMVELERAQVSHGYDPEAAEDLLRVLVPNVRRIQSPFLERQITLLKEILEVPSETAAAPDQLA